MDLPWNRFARSKSQVLFTCDETKHTSMDLPLIPPPADILQQATTDETTPSDLRMCIVYGLCTPDGTLVYNGSSVQSQEHRLTQHKVDARRDPLSAPLYRYAMECQAAKHANERETSRRIAAHRPDLAANLPAGGEDQTPTPSQPTASATGGDDQTPTPNRPIPPVVPPAPVATATGGDDRTPTPSRLPAPPDDRPIPPAGAPPGPIPPVVPPPAPPGRDGNRGPPGTPGAAGRDGDRGPPGTPGAAGRDGKIAAPLALLVLRPVTVPGAKTAYVLSVDESTQKITLSGQLQPSASNTTAVAGTSFTIGSGEKLWA
eukprot:COSAG06_NODE_12197_length_1410_cov_3.519451_1_plen_316_part_00